MSEALKRTVLYEEHCKLAAKLVDFAGWEMPIQYQGISKEHMAVREACGIFDVSHMAEFIVVGEDVAAFLDYTCLNRASKLKVGRAQYSMVSNYQGGLVDDIFVYRLAETSYLIIVNASNHHKVWEHFHKLQEGYRVGFEDVSEQYALIAVQGPSSTEVLSQTLGSDIAIKRNAFIDCDYRGQTLKIARTGYTGEAVGYEVLIPNDVAASFWAQLLQAGALACGLGARDSLRLEAGFPLYGHEFHDDSNPLCSDYAWVVKDKDFYGREAMWTGNCQQRLVALELRGKGIAREGYEVYAQDQHIGSISSGIMSPLSKKAIAFAWIDSAHAELGKGIEVQIRNKRVAAEIVKAPFLSKQ